jgi:hypothetical protein
MRVSIVSILLAGGMLALAACSTSGEPLTLAERTEQCRGGEVTPTGRQTGDARQDYECRTAHAGGVFDRQDRNVTGAGAARSTAIDRSLQGRIN